MSQEQRNEHFRLCGEFLRVVDRDRWLACLYASDQKRPFLFALYAFNAEISRIRELVSQPLLGEMRIQWWVDALSDPEAFERPDLASHPTADALLTTLREFDLPKQALLDYLEARRFDLYDDPAPDQSFLDCYCDETCSILFAFAARILGDVEATSAAEAAGKAFAQTGMIRALSWQAARRRCFVPEDLLSRRGLRPDDIFARKESDSVSAAISEWRSVARARLDQARYEISLLKPPAREAFRLLALTKFDLCELERKKNQVFAPATSALWRRQWALWRFCL